MIPKAFSNLIDNGVNRNILVFDDEHSSFHVRLVDLMKDIGKNNGSPIHTILISKKAFNNLFGRFWLNPQKNIVSNVEIVGLDGLGIDSDFQNYYYDIGGSLASGCSELVLGLVDPASDYKERVLLGSF